MEVPVSSELTVNSVAMCALPVMILELLAEVFKLAADLVANFALTVMTLELMKRRFSSAVISSPLPLRLELFLSSSSLMSRFLTAATQKKF